MNTRKWAEKENGYNGTITCLRMRREKEKKE